MIYLVAGLIIGFFVALPVGASAVMCISRTIQYGFSAGLFTGFGVALADLLYGIFAVFGLFAISGETLESQPVLRLAGAFCIMFLGLRMMSKINVTTNKIIDHETAIKDIITGFFVTISNPLTIIAFIAALSYVNYLMEEINYLGSSLIVLGIFVGSFAWWLILCSFSKKFKEKLTPRFVRKINLISGGLIFLFGILLVLSIKRI
tara:strand:+ start:176 stop:790 length:615 start_codon:yes stop_codon:yes gene_type:complete